MKPVIGITSTIVKLNEYSEGVYVHQDYHRSVQAGGGLPVVLPLTDPGFFKQLIDLCDGVIFSGGEDVDPARYGEEPDPKLGKIFPDRDRTEAEALRYVLDQGKPLLAICRGVQILNVALGGSLHQDLPSRLPSHLAHMQQGVSRGKDTHEVEIAEDSRLRHIFGQSRVRVNSLHHQGLKRVAPPLQVTASAPDGVIEAVEIPSPAFAVGVQWHPESMAAEQDALMKKLFDEFIRQSNRFAQARRDNGHSPARQ